MIRSESYQWIGTITVAVLVAIVAFVALVFNRTQTKNSSVQVNTSNQLLERERNRSINESTAFMQLEASHRAALMHDGHINHLIVEPITDGWSDMIHLISVPDFSTISIKKYHGVYKQENFESGDVLREGIWGLEGAQRTTFCKRIENRVKLFSGFRFDSKMKKDMPGTLSSAYHLAAALTVVLGSSQIWTFEESMKSYDKINSLSETRVFLTRTPKEGTINKLYVGHTLLATGTYLIPFDFQKYWQLLLSVGTEWHQSETHDRLYASNFWGRTTIFQSQGQIIVQYQYNNLLCGRVDSVGKWEMEGSPHPNVLDRCPRLVIAIQSGENMQRFYKLDGIHCEGRYSLTKWLEIWLEDSGIDRNSRARKKLMEDNGSELIKVQQWLYIFWKTFNLPSDTQHYDGLNMKKRDIKILLFILGPTLQGRSLQLIEKEKRIMQIKERYLRKYCEKTKIPFVPKDHMLRRLFRITSVASKVRYLPEAYYSMNLRGVNIAYIG